MSKKDHKIYIKLRIDNPLNGMMDAFFLSQDIERINSWDGNNDEEIKKKNVNLGNLGIFQSVSRKFISDMSVYQNSVSFIMSILPHISLITDQKKIKEFAKKNGKQIEAGPFEVYEFNKDKITELKKIIELIHSQKTGIEQIPKLFFLGLISAYDAFLAELIRAIMLEKPEMLSSSEKNISFKDLFSMGSIESAKDFLIEKEIESVIRQSHHEQIKWLEKKLDMHLTKGLEIFPQFIEMCERRNLFTHTNGIVSSQYCKVCKENNFNTQAQPGDQLDIDAVYFKNSTSIIFEIGVKLTQVIWRKLVPDDLIKADDELNAIAYEIISKGDYNLSDSLLYFGLGMKKHGSDATKKMMIVNRANSLKLGGKKEEALAVIDKEDWSAATDNYKICVAAIKDNVKQVVSLMKKVVDAEQMSIQDIREWPVFNNIRSDEKFAEAFEKCFNEKLIRD